MTKLSNKINTRGTYAEVGASIRKTENGIQQLIALGKATSDAPAQRAASALENKLKTGGIINDVELGTSYTVISAGANEQARAAAKAETPVYETDLRSYPTPAANMLREQKISQYKTQLKEITGKESNVTVVQDYELSKYGMTRGEAMVDRDGNIFIADDVTLPKVVSAKLAHEVAHIAARDGGSTVADVLDVARRVGWNVDEFVGKSGRENYIKKEMSASNLTRAEAEAKVNTRYMEEEAFANFIGKLSENDDMARALATQSPSAAQKVIDFINRVLDTLGVNKHVARYDTLARKLRRYVQQTTNTKVGRSGESRQSEQKNVKYDINRSFARDVQEWYQNDRDENIYLTLGSTGPVLQGLGAIESDIYMDSDKVKTILQTHPEMTVNEIKRIPEILEDPVLILKSQNNVRSQYGNTRLVVFGSVKATDGRYIMCVFDLRPTENGFLIDDMQKVSSSYTKDRDPVKFVSDSKVCCCG